MPLFTECELRDTSLKIAKRVVDDGYDGYGSNIQDFPFPLK